MLVNPKAYVALFTALRSESTVHSWLYVQSDDKNVGPAIKRLPVRVYCVYRL
jgi:hypothetical protein